MKFSDLWIFHVLIFTAGAHAVLEAPILYLVFAFGQDI